MATKEELEEMAKDLYKRLGGVRTKDGRIVRALLAVWKAAELNAAQQPLALDGACACAQPKLLWKESSGWYCGVCYKSPRQ